MTAPYASFLWPVLFRCKDPEVSGWARMLRESLDKPFAKIPLFTLDPFDRLRKLISVSPRDWAQIEAETDRLKKSGKDVPPELKDKVNPVGGLKELCDAPAKDWVAILSEGDRLVTTGKKLTPELKQVVEDARKRVAARDSVQKAADARDPRAIVTAYKPDLVDDWADAALVRAAKAAAGQVALLDKLKAAAASPGDGKALIKLWDEAASKLAGIGEAKGYEKLAESWRVRAMAAELFLRAFNRIPPTERELADAWQAVTGAGPLHPSLNDTHRKRAEDALRWAPLLDKLRRIPNIASYENDTKLVVAWGTGGALQGCREAAEFATRVSEANARLVLVQALEKAIKVAEAGGSEDAVIEAASKLAVELLPPARHPRRGGCGRRQVDRRHPEGTRPRAPVGPQSCHGVRPPQGEEPEARETSRQGQPDALCRSGAVCWASEVARHVRNHRRRRTACRQAGRKVAIAVGQARPGSPRADGETARNSATGSQ